MGSLTGKKVFITGAEQGIGKETARKLIEAGCDIYIHYFSGEEGPRELIAIAQQRGGKAACGYADLTNEADAARCVAEGAAFLGGIDILVNNAGTIRRADALTFSEKEWDDVLNLNLKSVFFLSQAVARQFIQQGDGGKIVNIASMLSFQGGIRVPSYTASKSGVLGITRLLANEWAAKGINVNAIAPGYMATNNTQPLREDEERNQAILERIPAGRWGAPKDLQGPVVFLASSAADYIHGYTLAVDGGWLAR